MKTKQVKCIDDVSVTAFIQKGRVYEVESENATNYFLRGVGRTGGFRQNRFVTVGEHPFFSPAGTKLKCDDATDSDGYLKVGVIYTVAKVSTSGTDYQLVGIQSWWGNFRFHVVDETGQPPPIINMTPKTTVTTTTLPILDANKAAELTFFKARSNPRECPCGSTRGICPDHP